jgi:(1->4)-alpha-D-glucan 1-alpha-D-glucosylmutase
MPEDWERVLTRLRALHAPLKRSILGVLEPGPNEDYLLYQTLLGLGWPDTALIDDAFRDRVETFMLKAAREAKVRTSWLRPDRNYEDALLGFLRSVLDPDQLTAAQGAVGDLAARLAWYGRFNSLAQTLLKLTAPGVPDLYQGSELWDLSLVDPDNRRPVDFDARRKLLERLQAIAALDDNARFEELTRLPLECDGSAAKLWLIWRTLQTRRKHPELWMDGDYHALTASGSGSAHVVAFARSLGSRRMVAVVARWPALLTGGVPKALRGEPVWGSTALAIPDAGPGQSWQDVLTGASHSSGNQAVCDLLRIFPVALLLAVDAQSVDSR